MKRLVMPALVFLAVVSSAACGSDDAASAADDLTQAGKKLVGAYVERGAGPIRALVLSPVSVSGNANWFFADIDAGIVCITTPCPSTERVEGTFTAGTKTITLKSETASDLAQQVLGKYQYRLEAGKLSLARSGQEQTLEPQASYCAAESNESDCEAQDLAHVECVGGWECTAESTCDWSCAAPKCQPVLCELFCENGFASDDQGCPICSCAEAKCPPFDCGDEPYCVNGFVHDENDCPICECKPDI